MPLPAPIRRLARIVVPHRLRAWRWQRALRSLAPLEEAVYQQLGGVVAAGPFEAMRYVRVAHHSAFGPKLLGTYERELHPCIEQIARAAPALVVDIGAAEGYYAVGMAARVPGAVVVAYELADRAQTLLQELADANGVGGRVRVRGACDIDGLNELLSAWPAGDVAVICDVEGAEATLLDPAAVPRLTVARILVELHELERPGVGKLLSDRFMATHEIEQIHAQPRRAADVRPDVASRLTLSPAQLARVLDEQRRGPMSWLWMRPRPRARTQ